MITNLLNLFFLVILLNDKEASPPRVNNNDGDDDVIILSDTQSDVNDDNCEVVMDSEDEHPADLRYSTFSAFNKPKNNTATEVCKPLSTKTTTTKEFDTPRNKASAFFFYYYYSSLSFFLSLLTLQQGK